jgi:dienelactone hydrolase
MQSLIASDIFGRTAALEELAHQLGSTSGAPLLVDPYGGVPQQVGTEAEAYARFKGQVGLDRYIQTLAAAIRRAAEPLALIGFSVGASAIWALSGESHLPPGSRAFCFYGSQIRHYAAVVPCIEMRLLFPRSESSFDVVDLMRCLSVQEGVVCHRTPYLHGFMNRLSPNFDQTAYENYLDLLKEWVAHG